MVTVILSWGTIGSKLNSMTPRKITKVENFTPEEETKIQEEEFKQIFSNGVLHKAILRVCEPEVKEENKTILKMLLKLVKGNLKLFASTIELQDKNGETCFHLIAGAKKENVKILLLLLDTFRKDEEIFMSQIFKENKNLDSALHIALESGHEKMAEIFVRIFDGKPKLLRNLLSRENNFGICTNDLICEYQHEKVCEVMIEIYSKGEKSIILTPQVDAKKEEGFDFVENENQFFMQTNFEKIENELEVENHLNSDQTTIFTSPNDDSEERENDFVQENQIQKNYEEVQHKFESPEIQPIQLSNSVILSSAVNFTKFSVNVYYFYINIFHNMFLFYTALLLGNL